MPVLVDTTIRLLGQEPLAGAMPTAALLQLAEILDKAGFAYLEVSGGGVFDTAVRRGVESPWERIRALNSRTKTPLAMALRGRFLVGSRPVGGDFVRRFVASAAESGIEVFRLHDPLNDVENLREAGEAITAAGKEFDAGLVYGSGYTGETEALVEQARKLPDLGATRVLVHDPSGSLEPQRAQELVDEHIGDEPVTPLAPRIAVRAAEHRLPSGLVAALDTQLRTLGNGDRLDEVLDELARIREEVGWPPLAAPIGQILGSQALLHVLSAARYQTVVDELKGLIEGRFGSPPGPIDPAVRRAVELVSGAPVPEEEPVDLEQLRAEAKDLASSEEELLLLALFGDEAEPLLQTIRGRSQRDESLAAGGVDQTRAERIREIVRIVQESGVGEVTIEDSGMRVSVRRTPEALEPHLAASAAEQEAGERGPAPSPASNGNLRIEAPMVGVFYRAPQPGAPPFVEEGDTVAPGQTLCILEAMKLMNEIKTDAAGIVRAIHVRNAEPVEFGQLLFELEPVSSVPPLDAV